MMSTLTRCARRASGACLFVVVVSVAAAQVTLSDVSFTTPQLRGKTYFEVTAIMNGPATSPYSVPIVLLYPVNPAERNGTAIVDFLNNTAMLLRAADTGGAEFNPTTPIGRVLLGEDFIGEHGYVYVGIQWHRDMIPFMNFHLGTAYVIPSYADQISITFDVGGLLHQPPASLPGALEAVSNRLAFGYSGSGYPLLSILEHPVLRSAFSSRFEGVLLGGVGRLSTPDPAPYGGPAGLGGAQPNGDLKTIVVNTETELQLLDGNLVRGESPNYRSYEIAGAAHNPTSLVDLNQFIGLPGFSTSTRQNPVAIGPVIRAMVEHLRNWTLGLATPPPSVSLGNPFNIGSMDLTPIYSGPEHLMDVPRSASDGNALGGIRLPPIVVPVGVHNGSETIATMPFSATTFGQMLSGTVEPYTTAQLDTRYPTHAAYVQAVTSAANAALAAGWILASDRDAYVATAQACAIGTGVALTPAQFLACFDL